MMVRIENLLLTLWVGALFGVGYLAVPVLFASLDDRQLAGELAGEMFRLVGYLGLGAGALLLASFFWQGARWRVWLVVAMLALVVVSVFVLQPMMVELKQHGLVPDSEEAREFARLHGVSSVLYLLTSVLGVGLVLAGPRSG